MSPTEQEVERVLDYQRPRIGVSPPQRDDAAIIRESWQHSDAFAHMYDRYAGQLYRYAYRRLGADAASRRRCSQRRVRAKCRSGCS